MPLPQGLKKPARSETFVIGPLLRLNNRELHRHVSFRMERTNMTYAELRTRDPATLLLAPPQGAPHLSSSTQDAPLLWRAMGQAWRQVFETFGIPVAPYPDIWSAGKAWLDS